MKSLLYILLSTVLVLAGCSTYTEVSVKFTQPQAVKAGDPVQFRNQLIGQVKSVKDKDGGVILELNLDPEKLDRLDSDSVAMVMAPPNRRVEIYSNGLGQTLKPGDQLQGMNNGLELATWTANNAMGSFQDMINAAANDFNTFMQNQDWEELNKQFNDSLSGLNEQSTQALDQIIRELEEFIKNMENQSSETIKEAEQFSRQLNEELRKYQSQGNDDLARMLQELLDSFNAMLDPGGVAPSNPDKGEPL